MKDERRSIGRSSRKWGKRVEVVTKSHRSYSEGLEREQNEWVKVIAKTNKLFDDAALACVRYGNF